MKKHLPLLRMLIIGKSVFRTRSIIIQLILLMVLLFSPVLTAQTVEKLKDRIQIVEAGQVPSLKSLVSERMPSIYIKSGAIQKDGNGSALLVFSDLVSNVTLYTVKPEFDNVKMISFKINSESEKSFRLDLNQLTAFSKLKYVLFSFTYDECQSQSEACLETIVRGMITGNMSGLTIVYQLSIPN